MILLKTARELLIMKEAGIISARALELAGKAVEPGVTTLEIDNIARKYIEGMGATPTFLQYNGFPNSICISINNEVIHGIPEKARKIMAGDIVSIDLGACFNGYNGDNAATFSAGDVSKEAQNLIDVTKQSLHEAINVVKAGNRIGDIGSAVQRYVEARGYSVVREYVGHGVGSSLHEDPSVPNYGTPGRGVRLVSGMTLAIEPMVNQGTHEVDLQPDGWTVLTKDGKLSAHFEHTVLVTAEGAVILTLTE